MKFYFEEFLGELAWIKSYSSHTLKAYKKDLSVYKEFKDSSYKNFHEFLSLKKLSARSQARIISCVRSYFKFCAHKGLHVSEQTLKVPRFPSSLPYALSVIDFSELIQAASDKCSHRNHRNHLILKVLFGCGLRASELTQLDIMDYHKTNSCFSILGKGQKERLVPLTELIETELSEYIKTDLPSLSQEPKALFINNKGRRLHRVDLWRWIRKWAKKANLSSKITPHKFRHSCATILLENGADLRTIQKLLGHASLQTTQIYTHITQNKLQKDIETHHPLSQLKIKKTI